MQPANAATMIAMRNLFVELLISGLKNIIDNIPELRVKPNINETIPYRPHPNDFSHFIRLYDCSIANSFVLFIV